MIFFEQHRWFRVKLVLMGETSDKALIPKLIPKPWEPWKPTNGMNTLLAQQSH